MSRDLLIQLLAARSVREGQFTLASGRTSSLYIDARLTTMSPEGLTLIGSLGLRALHDSGWKVDAVGGLTLGADPVAYAISYASAASAHPLRAFTVRKEPKTHGAGKLIEGPFQSGDRVALVEDVVTSGASTLTAAAAIRSAGGEIGGVLAVVDREEGGSEAIKQAGLEFLALISVREILPYTRAQSVGSR